MFAAVQIANYYTAMDANLDIIPVLSKIDLPHSDIKGTGEQIQVAFDMDPASALAISSKTGQGIDAVFRAIIDRIQPPPTKVKPGVDPCSIPLRALVFDSWSVCAAHTKHSFLFSCLSVSLCLLFLSDD